MPHYVTIYFRRLAFSIFFLAFSANDFVLDLYTSLAPLPEIDTDPAVNGIAEPTIRPAAPSFKAPSISVSNSCPVAPSIVFLEASDTNKPCVVSRGNSENPAIRDPFTT